jgi:hypothetical protein
MGRSAYAKGLVRRAPAATQSLPKPDESGILGQKINRDRKAMQEHNVERPVPVYLVRQDGPIGRTGVAGLRTVGHYCPFSRTKKQAARIPSQGQGRSRRRAGLPRPGALAALLRAAHGQNPDEAGATAAQAAPVTLVTFHVLVADGIESATSPGPSAGSSSTTSLHGARRHLAGQHRLRPQSRLARRHRR